MVINWQESSWLGWWEGGREGRETVVLWTYYLDVGYLTGEIPTLPNGFIKCVIIHH